jgi:hypothetical protein
VNRWAEWTERLTYAETDESLRKRVLYVAGDAPVAARVIVAAGGGLDSIAELYRLRRRHAGEVAR